VNRRAGRYLFILSILVLGALAGFTLRFTLKGAGGPRAGRPALVVDRSKADGTYASIAEALKSAQSGDVIQVREASWDEVLRLESGGTLGQGVTVEGVTEDGQPVLWQAPAEAKDLSSLIHLSAVPGFRLRNFTLNGRDVTQHLVTLAGPSSGLTVGDVKLQGFRASGIRLTSAVGEEAAPILLERLHIAPAHRVDAGVLLDAYPDQPCRHVRLCECKLEGACQTGVVVSGPVLGLELERCRLAGLSDGILYRKGPVLTAVQLTLTENSFQDIRRAGLHFEAPPPVDKSLIRLHGNRFQKMRKLGEIDGFRPEPPRSNAAWIWWEKAAEGAMLAFRKEFSLESVPARAVLSIAADRSCTIWLNGQRVGSGEFSDTAKRVQAFDVARYLKRGENALAVEAKGGSRRAGVLAELNHNAAGALTRLLVSDVSWKVSAQPGAGWQSSPFDDSGWATVSVVAPQGQGDSAWSGLIWDAVVQEQFEYQSGRVFPTPTGNERDAGSSEGFPTFEAVVRPIR
jgi:hypothetical protein